MALFQLDATGDAGLLESTTTIPKFNQIPLVKIPNYQIYRLVDDIDSQTDDFENTGKVSDDTNTSDALEFFGLTKFAIDENDIEAALAELKIKPTTIEIEIDSILERLDDVYSQQQERKPKIRQYVDLDHSDFNPLTGKHDLDKELIQTDVEQIMASSALKAAIEKNDLPPIYSKQKQKKLKQQERDKNKGKDWYNMPATEVTEELENDLKILQMRSVLDPKRFYKKNDLKVLPKYFQVGIVQHSPLDYYNERNERKNKKHFIVDELLKDEDTLKYAKRKYQEVVCNREKHKALKRMKKMKKRNK